MNNTAECAVFVRPLKGNRRGGDTAVVRQEGDSLMAVIVDVLGHGEEARELAVVMEEFLMRLPLTDPASMILALDSHISGGRGAAVGLAMLDLDTGWLRYVGVGNTSIRRFGDHEDRLLSQPGIVGIRVRRPREERLQLAPGDVLVLYTDGVRDHFELDEYPRILGHSAATVSRTIVHRFGKPHDDAACVTVRLQR